MMILLIIAVAIGAIDVVTFALLARASKEKNKCITVYDSNGSVVGVIEK